MRNTVRSRH